MKPKLMGLFSLIMKRRKRKLPTGLKENTKFGCQMEGNFSWESFDTEKCIFLLRLMVVSYYVDGESGFVPTITFEEGYTPQWKD